MPSDLSTFPELHPIDGTSNMTIRPVSNLTEADPVDVTGKSYLTSLQ